MVGVFTNQVNTKYIVGAAMLKHQQWLNLSGLVGTPTTDKNIKLPEVVSPDQPRTNDTYPALPY